MTEPLNWGIIATGTIARTFARGVAHSKSGRVVAVGSRTREAAGKFAAELGGLRAHGSYEALLADPEVRAVYIATPHPQHLEWVERAAAAGKHVLCEKPLAMTRAEAARAVEACRARGVLLMEAFMYRCHPQTAKIGELVRSGALGRVRLVQATFSFAAGFDPAHRLFNKALGGGGILDVGCYPVSLARLVAGAADGQAFADPVRVTGAVELHPESGADVYAAATLQFANGIIAQVASGVMLLQDNSARIYGTDGWLQVTDPWVPAREGGSVTMHLRRRGETTAEEIVVTTDEWLYGLEADAFAAALAAGKRDVPQMSTADTLGNMAVLDAWAACACDAKA
ncbi:MAG TPA: Gfo/Idh/MocA family oxidoreductase [Opitutus sp.]|nr:Gfo/Idh/MocA family oxidoreductase [Opitutus sp.]